MVDMPYGLFNPDGGLGMFWDSAKIPFTRGVEGFYQGSGSRS